MYQLLLLLLVGSGAMATLRLRRQAEAAPEVNWWDNLNVGVVRGSDVGNDINVDVKKLECEGPGTVCVPYYQCGDEKVSTDGKGIIDTRIGSPCERYLDVCCKTPAAEPVVAPPPPAAHKGCGIRNNQGVHLRIAGLSDTQTQFGEYPWMAEIIRVELGLEGEEVNVYLCGGALIALNIVLTAAHSIGTYGAEKLKVRAGEWDTQNEYELFPHQDRKIKHVIVHPDFNSGNLYNDFAVLILESPFVLAPNVDSICLPNYGDSFDHNTCYATGWGKDKFGTEGRYQKILKQVALKVVPKDQCEKSLKTTRLGEYFRLHSSFMCAGGDPGVDTCKGDGGSPLVCAKPHGDTPNANYYIVGIVAWGIGCGENGLPGVYADVTQGISWIQTVIEPYRAL